MLGPTMLAFPDIFNSLLLLYFMKYFWVSLLDY